MRVTPIRPGRSSHSGSTKCPSATPAVTTTPTIASWIRRFWFMVCPPSNFPQRSPQPPPILFFPLSSCSVTNLKAISTRILEEDGVVTSFPGLGNFITGAFHVPRSRTGGNLSQLIDLVGAVGPEGDAAFVRTVLGRLSDAKKLRDA